eukprot:2550818-Rhodomonas_salina.4
MLLALQAKAAAEEAMAQQVCVERRVCGFLSCDARGEWFGDGVRGVEGGARVGAQGWAGSGGCVRREKEVCRCGVRACEGGDHHEPRVVRRNRTGASEAQNLNQQSLLADLRQNCGCFCLWLRQPCIVVRCPGLTPALRHPGCWRAAGIQRRARDRRRAGRHGLHRPRVAVRAGRGAALDVLGHSAHNRVGDGRLRGAAKPARAPAQGAPPP